MTKNWHGRECRWTLCCGRRQSGDIQNGVSPECEHRNECRRGRNKGTTERNVQERKVNERRYQKSENNKVQQK
jgi:hypothetical protein